MKGTLVGKKKVAKNDGVLFKNEVSMILKKIETRKSEGRIGRNATTTNNRIWHPTFRRGETWGYEIF